MANAMNVMDLIDELKKYPDEALVCFGTGHPVTSTEPVSNAENDEARVIVLR